MGGVVLGHDIEGLAIVRNDFGTEQHVRFDDLRLETPFDRAAPNWHSLPVGGRLLKPSSAVLDILTQTMSRIIAPAPTYQELAEEIWGRGFEIFLVGGTVRDILAGKTANDIDFVTTMPLNRMVGFLQQMFLTRETGFKKRGYIRLGGTPDSGDPFIDLKVFSDSLPGTADAAFGVGFDRDAAFRDFACNAVYFDPVNQVVVDPTGHGVSDCGSATLRLVDEHHDRHQRGQVFIRGVKFVARGFVLTDESHERLVRDYMPCLPAMKVEFRKRYFRTQVLSKHKGLTAKAQAVSDFKATLEQLGCPHAWDEHFAFEDGELDGE